MINELANRALTAVVRVMGEPIIYTRGESTAQLKGVFQNSHYAVDPETGMTVNSTQPVVLIDGWSLPFEPKNGDAVVARGGNYRVRDAQPDGHSGWKLLLHRSNTP